MASWLAFFLVSVALVPGPDHQFGLPHPPFPPFFFCIFPLLIGFYYFNNRVLINGLLSKEWRQLYVISVVLCGVGIVYFSNWLVVVSTGQQLPQEVVQVNVLLAILLFLVVFLASSGARIIRFWFAAEERKREIEFESTASELIFLKSQINPHFLFNTLNNIYTLTILKSDKAAEAVLKLADMMRYTLTETGSKPVEIQKEIDYLRQYIALQQIRLTDRVIVDFSVFGEANGLTIAPLILIPFVENAFKYGVSTKEPSTIRIHIFLKAHELILQTENRRHTDVVPQKDSTGVGLKNVKRRLELLYADHHWLRIETIQDTFFVDLTLSL